MYEKCKNMAPKVNLTVAKLMIGNFNTRKRGGDLPREYKVTAELLSILKNIGAPLYSYEEVMRWSHRSQNSGHRFYRDFLNEHNYTKFLSIKHGLDGREPRLERI